MLEKVSTSSSARVSVARSASASPRGRTARPHEIAPAEDAHDTQDDRPRWQEAGSEKESPEHDQGPGAGARQAIDEALKALLPEAAPRERQAAGAAARPAAPMSGDVTGRRGAVSAPAQAAASPFSRAVGAYGLQSELQGHSAILRPGAVFSEQF